MAQRCASGVVKLQNISESKRRCCRHCRVPLTELGTELARAAKKDLRGPRPDLLFDLKFAGPKTSGNTFGTQNRPG